MAHFHVGLVLILQLCQSADHRTGLESLKIDALEPLGFVRLKGIDDNVAAISTARLLITPKKIGILSALSIDAQLGLHPMNPIFRLGIEVPIEGKCSASAKIFIRKSFVGIPALEQFIFRILKNVIGTCPEL